jgi:molybdenum cofactor cytidylyltransferase
MAKIMPIVLAAGDALRMGSFPKALLPLGQNTFLGHILEVLREAGFSGCHVVLGRREQEVRPVAAAHNACITVNPQPERGQFSSLRLALDRLNAACAGCLVWPVDQPRISPGLVRSLAALFQSSSAQLVLPRRRGMSGHPAIFGRRLIEDLLAAPVTANPKDILAPHRAAAVWLETEEAGAFEDVDTPTDYFRLTGETLADALRRRANKRE